MPIRAHGCAARSERSQSRAVLCTAAGDAGVRDAISKRCALARSLRPGTGRHLAGHGVFSRRAICCSRPNTTTSRCAAWSASATRVPSRSCSEIDTHGIDPHEVAWLPDGRTLLVANGGIMTHPRTFRRKLNIPTMDPSLCAIDSASGAVPRSVASSRSSAEHPSPRADYGRHRSGWVAVRRCTDRRAGHRRRCIAPKAGLRLLQARRGYAHEVPGLRRQHRCERCSGSDRRCMSVRRGCRMLVAQRRALSWILRDRRDLRTRTPERWFHRRFTARRQRLSTRQPPCKRALHRRRSRASDPVG